jgi:hypothetical protein
MKFRDIITKLNTNQILSNEILFHLDIHSLLNLSQVNKQLNGVVIDFISRHDELFKKEINKRIKALKQERKDISQKISDLNEYYAEKREMLKRLWVGGNASAFVFMSVFIIAHIIYNKAEGLDVNRALIIDVCSSIAAIIIFQAFMFPLKFYVKSIERNRKDEIMNKRKISENIRGIRHGYGRFFKEQKGNSNDLEMGVSNEFNEELRAVGFV